MSSNEILCYYHNATSGIQVVKVLDLPHCHLERVIFPGQRFMFMAPAQAQLEVFSSDVATAMLVDRIPCQSLQLEESWRSPVLSLS